MLDVAVVLLFYHSIAVIVAVRYLVPNKGVLWTVLLDMSGRQCSQDEGYEGRAECEPGDDHGGVDEGALVR